MKIEGTEFQKAVWKEISKIPIGETQAITSNKKNIFNFFLIENKYVPKIIPIKAP